MLRDRVCKTFSGQNSGADFVHDWTQSSDIAVVGEQLQPGVKARACFEKQGEVAGKNRNVFCAWPIEEADRSAPIGTRPRYSMRWETSAAVGAKMDPFTSSPLWVIAR